MNVYDFDGTIFPGDCSIGFAFWCLKRHPKLWFSYLPDVLKHVILYKKGKVPNHLMQRKMFSYLTMIDDLFMLKEIPAKGSSNHKKAQIGYAEQTVKELQEIFDKPVMESKVVII